VIKIYIYIYIYIYLKKIKKNILKKIKKIQKNAELTRGTYLTVLVLH